MACGMGLAGRMGDRSMRLSLRITGHRIAAQADWVDFDGPLWLKADYADGVQLSDGYLIPPRPGFWGGD